MPSTPSILWLILWAAWVLQAVFSAWQVRKFASYLRRPARPVTGRFMPPAVVIMPFKGLERDLAGAVRALCEQDYPGYRLVLVVDSPQDPALAVLRRELARYPSIPAEVLVAGLAGPNEGQKIHNQLFAIRHIDGPCEDQTMWVFADSDAVPDNLWLQRMAGPLGQKGKTGLTTGYRWLVPAAGDPRRGRTALWSHLGSMMNSSVACQYGRDGFNHAWGGSMAILAGAARRGNLVGRLEGALCDDFQFSRLARDLGLRVYFVRGGLSASEVDFDLPGLVNFAHRQYLLTRVYAPRLYVAALAFTSLYVAGWLSAWGYLAWSLVREPSARRWVWPAAAILAVFLANQVRVTMRRRVVEAGLPAAATRSLAATLRLERWATTLYMTVHWLLIVRSAFGRRMRWRGLEYKLTGPQRVQRIN